MEILIEKIGKILKADITVNGLTLIAGKNDTGKSTVGKFLYSAIEAFGNYKKDFENNRMFEIRQTYLLPLLKQYVSIADKNNPYLTKITDLIDAIRSEIYRNVDENLLSRKYILDILDNIYHYNIDTTPQSIKQSVENIFSNIERIDTTPEEQKINEILASKLRLNFDKVINNSKYNESGNFSIINSKDIVLSGVIRDNNLHMEYCKPFGIRTLPGKAFYIESPFVLETIFARKNSWINLLRTLREEKKENLPLLNDGVLYFIQNNIFGQAIFDFDKNKRSFFYQVDKESKKLELSNVANGIKSFAIIFTLLKNNELTQDSVLIIDEPENHLHPQWQIKYAEMICLLVSKGFFIVINSHSPTFIHALDAYAYKYNIKDKCNFYLAQALPTENYSNIENVNDNMEKIYSDLIEPTDILYYGV